ncbi:MAG: glycosyltransferase [Clostridiales bacterium]|nr:glycosyltransferase [Clostridiales bacterium]
MKIAIDLTNFNKEFKGGKEQVICNLITGFISQSPQTELVLFCYEDYENKAKKLAKNATIITFKRWKIKRFIQDMYLRTFIIKQHLDNVDILFFPIYYTGFHKFSIPTIVLPHDIHFKSHPSSFGVLSRIKENILYKIDFSLRDYVMAISDFDYHEMIKYFPAYIEKITKIYNPIVAPKTIRKSKRKHLLAINVGFAHKNIKTLIKAYSLIKDQCQLPLILIGKSYDDVNINEMIKNYGLQDYITYMGYVEDGNLKQLFIDAYAYITPSIYEGFGMTAVEAMLYKVPVISSKQEALVEVTFNKATYYEPYNDAKALAKEILKLIKCYPDEVYLNNLKAQATKIFHFEKIAIEYLKFFKKISQQIIYVDPMSYHNLALYDHSLLSAMSSMDIIYVGNSNYNLSKNHQIKRLYDYSRYSLTIKKVSSYLFSQKKLYKLIKKHHIKVVHLQWSRMAFIDYLFIKYMKRKLHIKFVYTSHDTFSHNFEQSKKKVYLKLMGIADRIIVHTKTSANILAVHGFLKVTVINHGLLDIKNMYPPEPIDYNKEKRIVFSLLGYMEEYKGTDLLVKAWLKSKKLMSNNRIQLVVIGKNKMNYHPVIRANSNIIFKDELLNDYAFTRWMEISDIVVLPYQTISQSGLLLTALSMNKHFVVNDVGEIAIPIKKYQLGWIINEQSVEGLQIQLEKIVLDIEKNGLSTISKETLERINNDYSWKISGEKTMAIYMKLLEKRV